MQGDDLGNCGVEPKAEDDQDEQASVDAESKQQSGLILRSAGEFGRYCDWIEGINNKGDK